MRVEDFKKSFGHKIQDLRRLKGLTQEELAEKIGRSVDTISNIERGFSSTRIETAATLAACLGVALPELFEFAAIDNKGRSHRREIERIIRLLYRCPKGRLPSLLKLIEQAIGLAG